MQKLFLIFMFCIIAVLACLCTFLGRITGRKIGFAGAAARWGTAVMLFAAFLPILLDIVTSCAWREILSLWSIMHFIPAVLSLTAAVLCVFYPKKPAYVTAFLAGLTGWVLWVWRRDVTVLEALASKLFDQEIDVFLQRIIISVCYAAALFLCGMGLGAAGRRIEEMPEPEKVFPSLSGMLILLSEPFAGQQIPLPAGEELCLGSDPADCQLILDMPGDPRCLCRVSWLDARNRYSVTACGYSGLLYEDGTPVPVNEPVVAEPGTVFLDGQTGQAVFQLGSQGGKECYD